jgi:alpha-tubulin suppressor-like RCC1 family protein
MILYTILLLIITSHQVLSSTIPFHPTSVVAGRRTTCALDGNTGKVLCVGTFSWTMFDIDLYNLIDVAYGTTPYSPLALEVPLPEPAIALFGNMYGRDQYGSTVLGEVWCVILKFSEAAYCYGSGYPGELGFNVGDLGKSPWLDTAKAIVLHDGNVTQSIAIGEAHTCMVVKPSGQLMCFGGNSRGQLLQGDTLARFAGTYVKNLFGRVQKVVTGAVHTVALMENAQVFSWGANGRGQLANSSRGVEFDVGKTNDTNFPICVGPPFPGNGRIPVDIAAGYATTCILFNTGHVSCAGKNDLGQTGCDIPSSQDSATLCDVQLSGPATLLAMGEYTNCAVVSTNNKAIECWGNTSYHMFGSYSNVDGYTIKPISIPIGHPVLNISIGSSHIATMVQLDNGDHGVIAFGNGYWGALGQNSRDTPVVDPNFLSPIDWERPPAFNIGVILFPLGFFLLPPLCAISIFVIFRCVSLSVKYGLDKTRHRWQILQDLRMVQPSQVQRRKEMKRLFENWQVRNNNIDNKVVYQSYANAQTTYNISDVDIATVIFRDELVQLPRDLIPLQQVSSNNVDYNNKISISLQNTTSTQGITSWQSIKSTTPATTTTTSPNSTRQIPIYGISLKHLCDLQFPPGWTTAQVAQQWFALETKEYKCSYVEKLMMFPWTSHLVKSKADVFISHAWRGNWQDLLDAIITPTLDSKDVFVWLDICVINQHTKSSVDESWWFDAFSTALRKIGKANIVLSPWYEPIAVTRSWCTFEWYVICSNRDMIDMKVVVPPRERLQLAKAMRNDTAPPIKILYQWWSVPTFYCMNKLTLMLREGTTTGIDACNPIQNIIQIILFIPISFLIFPLMIIDWFLAMIFGLIGEMLRRSLITHVLDVTFFKSLLQSIDVRNAQAFKDSDRVAILRLIESIGVDQVNRAIKEPFKIWLRQVAIEESQLLDEKYDDDKISDEHKFFSVGTRVQNLRVRFAAISMLHATESFDEKSLWEDIFTARWLEPLSFAGTTKEIAITKLAQNATQREQLQEMGRPNGYYHLDPRPNRPSQYIIDIISFIAFFVLIIDGMITAVLISNGATSTQFRNYSFQLFDWFGPDYPCGELCSYTTIIVYMFWMMVAIWVRFNLND